jgi:hypothetical protein
LPVRFRTSQTSEWSFGYTENLSDAGAIIRCEAHLMPATEIDMVITLPASGAHAGGCVVGHATVIRSFSLVPRDRHAAFAIAFTQCRLARP